jgi:hypothetical protein
MTGRGDDVRSARWQIRRDRTRGWLRFPDLLSVSDAAALVLAPPPPGKLYQGFFYSAVSPETDDANEHNVTPAH